MGKITHISGVKEKLGRNFNSYFIGTIKTKQNRCFWSIPEDNEFEIYQNVASPVPAER